MAQGQGYNAWAGIGVQSTLGTTVARTKFVDFISESVKYQTQRKQWNNVGNTALRVNTELGRHSEGSIEVYGAFEGLESFFKAAFGSASVSTTNPGGTAYNHNYALKDAMASPGLSLEINRDVTSFLYEGCQIDEFEFIQEPNDYLRVRFGFRGRNETLISASSPSFLTPLKVHSSQLVCLVSTVATTINSFRLLVRNNLTGFRGQLGSPDSKEFIRGGKRSVTGSISLAFENTTRYAEFIALTNVSLDLTYVGAVITGGETYRYRLLISQLNWDGDTPPVGNSGPIDFEMPFTAFETTRGGNNELAFTIENQISSVT